MMNATYAFGILNDTKPDELGNAEEHDTKCFKKGWLVYLFLFVIPLFSALHMHYLDHIFPDFDLTSKLFTHSLKQTGSLLYILAIATIVLSLVVYHVRKHYEQGTLKTTLCIYFVLGSVLGICSGILGANYSMHLHHSLPHKK